MNPYAPLLTRLSQTRPSEWKPEELSLLRRDELEVLCRLMCSPHAGSKKQMITRLLDVVDLRLTLAGWGEELTIPAFDAVASRYKLTELRAFAKRAGTYRWVNKRGVVAGLFKWRNECRMRGQKATVSPEVEERLTGGEQKILPLIVSPLKAQPVSKSVLCDLGGNDIHPAAEFTAEWLETIFLRLPVPLKSEDQHRFKEGVTAQITSEWEAISKKHAGDWLEDWPPVVMCAWPYPGHVLEKSLKSVQLDQFCSHRVGFFNLEIYPWRIQNLLEK